MKKLSYLLIAAFATLAVASCVKDQIEAVPQEGSVGQTEFTVALTPGTRTDLVEGKTVWVEGDKLWVSNGAAVDTIVVPASADGQASFSFKTEKATPTATNPDVYVVYPAKSGKKVADGIVTVDVPSVQNGMFESANICAGKAFLGTIEMHNVTGVLKINVPEETAAPIYQVVFSGVDGAALSGSCTVDFTGLDPVVKAGATASSVAIQVDGAYDDLYAAVIPGTYAAGFKMTAATVDFEHASETKVSTVANTVKINQIVDLGTIGTDLKPLSGDGTEATPYLVENLGHMIALSSAVDNGEESNSFAGKHFLLTNDISGVTLPIGVNSGEKNNHPFCGDFDGNNHTITIDINGSVMAYPHRIGLFGALSSGANIHDLTVDGKIVSTGEAVGAIIGRIDIPADGSPVTLSKLTNKASVTASGYAGGVLGYAKPLLKETGTVSLVINDCSNYGAITTTADIVGGVLGYVYGPESAAFVTISDCKNNGKITGRNGVGGIGGRFHYAKVERCVNNENVVSTATSATGMYINPTSTTKYTYTSTAYEYGTGGIAGWAYSSPMDNCSNNGTISGFIKVGGIVGASSWSNLTKCTNVGSVKASGYFDTNVSSQNGMGYGSVAGGIVGWAHQGGAISGCTNEGAVTGLSGGTGGIVGFANASRSGAPSIADCTNSGTIKVTSNFSTIYRGSLVHNNAGTGGICGAIISQIYIASSKIQFQFAPSVTGCTNNGEVTAEWIHTGGIVGLSYETGNGASNKIDKKINKCVNNGNVTGAVRVGGILGLSSARYWGNTTITNSSNHGVVKSTSQFTDPITKVDCGTSVGGLAGAVSSNGGTSYQGKSNTLDIKNCYNDGRVVYPVAVTAPYAGGIAGYLWSGSNFQNNYNFAAVVPDDNSTPTETALAALGGLAGYQKANSVHYCYSSQDVLSGQIVGKSGTANRTDTVCSFDPADGVLATPVTANSIQCVYLLDALNEWQNYYVENGYFNWTGPAGHPVHDTTMD